MLIFGRDPSHKLTGQPQGYLPMVKAMKQAIVKGDLPAQLVASGPITFASAENYLLDDDEKIHVRRVDVCAWLRKIGWADAFFFLIPHDQWPNANPAKSMVADKVGPQAIRERTSLLRIIRVLAKMAEANGRGTAVAVERGLEELGFKSPKVATIRKLITEATELEPDANE